LVVAWLTTAVAIPPATVKYPAIFRRAGGRMAGLANKEAPKAASSNPPVLTFLKNFGVGACTLCITFIHFILIGYYYFFL
jgi:hypothetical protein